MTAQPHAQITAQCIGLSSYQGSSACGWLITMAKWTLSVAIGSLVAVTVPMQGYLRLESTFGSLQGMHGETGTNPWRIVRFVHEAGRQNDPGDLRTLLTGIIATNDSLCMSIWYTAGVSVLLWFLQSARIHGRYVVFADQSEIPSKQATQTNASCTESTWKDTSEEYPCKIKDIVGLEMGANSVYLCFCLISSATYNSGWMKFPNRTESCHKFRLHYAGQIP